MQAVLIILGGSVAAVIISLGVMKALEIIRAKVQAHNEGDNS